MKELKSIAGCLAVLIIAITAEAWAAPIADIIDPLWGVSVPADVPADVTPVIRAEPLPDPSEVPEEDDEITAALLEQGYYRDDVPLPYLEQDLLQSACEEAGVDYALALAVIEQETGFRNVMGDDGASAGYMQIQARWWSGLMDKLGVTDLMDPYGNFRVGCAILAQHIEQYGLPDALTVYNTGHAGESEYSRSVMELAERWAADVKKK